MMRCQTDRSVSSPKPSMKLEVVLGGHGVGEHRGPRVVDEAVALDGREDLLGPVGDRLAERGRVAHPVEAGALGVHEHPLEGFEEVDVERLVLDEHAFDATASPPLSSPSTLAPG